MNNPSDDLAYAITDWLAAGIQSATCERETATVGVVMGGDQLVARLYVPEKTLALVSSAWDAVHDSRIETIGQWQARTARAFAYALAKRETGELK